MKFLVDLACILVLFLLFLCSDDIIQVSDPHLSNKTSRLGFLKILPKSVLKMEEVPSFHIQTTPLPTPLQDISNRRHSARLSKDKSVVVHSRSEGQLSKISANQSKGKTIQNQSHAHATNLANLCILDESSEVQESSVDFENSLIFEFGEDRVANYLENVTTSGGHFQNCNIVMPFMSKEVISDLMKDLFVTKHSL